MKKIILLLVFTFFYHTGKSQYYFPPVNSNQWDTVSPAQLGWCVNKLDTVYKYLEDRNSKGFIILKDGKIAVEKYFGSFTQDSLWYWASVGKSLTAFLTGVAQQEGYFDINDSASKYLGKGWTSCTPQQEGSITLKHLLTMTSGLNDLKLPDPDCTDPGCFEYKADAGTRWAYHSGAYYMVQAAIDSATGLSVNQYTNQKIRSITGMQGIWFDNLFISRLRDMARFGSLVINKGRWASTAILNDSNYFNSMVNTSQSINPSYGYLWWLNGKATYKAPKLQTTFNGPLIPNAPAEMYAGLGKNDQKLYIIPSENLIVVRMGDASGQPTLAVSSFDNELWGLLNEVFCANPPTNVVSHMQQDITLYPNPVSNILSLDLGSLEGSEAVIYNLAGKEVMKTVVKGIAQIDVSTLKNGVYTIRIISKHNAIAAKFIKR